MRVLKDLDLVEQLGSGMRRILEVYDETVFEFTDHFMFVTFPFESGYHENNATEDVAINVVLTERENQILKLLEKDNTETADTLASSLNITPRTAQRHLKALQNKGVLMRKGARKSGYWEMGES